MLWNTEMKRYGFRSDKYYKNKYRGIDIVGTVPMRKTAYLTSVHAIWSGFVKSYLLVHLKAIKNKKVST